MLRDAFLVLLWFDSHLTHLLLSHLDQTVCVIDKSKGCSQFCKPGYQSYECSCAYGWKLKQREKCEPAGEFPVSWILPFKQGKSRLQNVFYVKPGNGIYRERHCVLFLFIWQLGSIFSNSIPYCLTKPSFICAMQLHYGSANTPEYKQYQIISK